MSGLVMDPAVSDTSPVVKGTWVTASHVVALIVDGWTWGEILRTHPELTEDDIRACLAYTVAGEPGPSLSRASVAFNPRVHVEPDRAVIPGPCGEVTRGRNPELLTRAVEIMSRLKEWAEGMGGWEAPAWAELDDFLMEHGK